MKFNTTSISVTEAKDITTQINNKTREIQSKLGEIVGVETLFVPDGYLVLIHYQTPLHY